MNSIRRFLVIVLLAVITLANFVAALQGYRSSVRNTEALFDEQLQNLAELLALSDFSHASDNIHYPAGKDKVFFQIWSNDTNEAQMLHRSNNAPPTDVVTFQPGFHSATFEDNLWHILVYHDQIRHHWIVVGERTNNRFIVAESIALYSILPNILSLPLIGILIWLVVGHGLKPLNELASALSRKKHNDLSPLILPDIPIELKTVIDSTNDLLMRLENSFAREKRFSGDAAHELRTPLSALKIHLYNLEKQLPENNDSMKQVNESIERMVHIIEQLLDLYRTTPEQFMAHFTEIDLYNLAQQVISNQWSHIEAKNQQLELQGSPCLLTGDQFTLEILIKNLIDNANKYTPVGGSLFISVSEHDGFAELCVEDSGTGIPEAFYQRVFERFYRVNGDQNNTMVIGCGLGLSIVQHIVELHGGKISLSPSRFSSGLKVTVSLPIQQATGGSDE